MNSDKKKMALVAIVTCLCALWAFLIKDLGMVILLFLATLIDLYIAAFKMKDVNT